MSAPRQTPLYSVHRELGARMVDFAGWQMPVFYKTGVIKEHQAVRSAVGLFDVSHMGEAIVRGPRAAEAVQRVITNDVGKLAEGAALYTVMCNPSGGIVDDCIWYRLGAQEFLVIFNAGNIDKDLAWLRDNIGAMAEIEDQSDATALIAVQGPRAVPLLDGMSDTDLAAVPRFHLARCEIAGVACLVARTGYTGEDGFEVACDPDRAVELWNAILGEGEALGAVPVGLGARDSLRLEARLCLYGNDIDDTTTPYEAGLGWVVKPDAGDFIGKEALLRQKAEGVTRKLVGFTVTDRAIPRHGYPIVDRARPEPVIGTVTSGGPGLTVGGAIGMGYVPAEVAGATQITIDCRGKDVAANIVKGPFYKREA